MAKPIQATATPRIITNIDSSDVCRVACRHGSILVEEEWKDGEWHTVANLADGESTGNFSFDTPTGRIRVSGTGEFYHFITNA